MEQDRSLKITGLKTVLAMLHRREMRLRSMLSSTLTSPEYRQEARSELETLLRDTRRIEDQISTL